MRAGLRIGLGGDEVDQLVGEVGHVGQLGPGPLQAGPELRHEVAHAGLAAGDAVGLEDAHLRPAQAEDIADRVVDLSRGGDAEIGRAACRERVWTKDCISWVAVSLKKIHKNRSSRNQTGTSYTHDTYSYTIQ